MDKIFRELSSTKVWGGHLTLLYKETLRATSANKKASGLHGKTVTPILSTNVPILPYYPVISAGFWKGSSKPLVADCQLLDAYLSYHWTNYPSNCVISNYLQVKSSHTRYLWVPLITPTMITVSFTGFHRLLFPPWLPASAFYCPLFNGYPEKPRSCLSRFCQQLIMTNRIRLTSSAFRFRRSDDCNRFSDWNAVVCVCVCALNGELYFTELATAVMFWSLFLESEQQLRLPPSQAHWTLDLLLSLDVIWLSSWPI